jgi:hypothetical protein
MLSPDFRDLEGRFSVARHVARYGDVERASRHAASLRAFEELNVQAVLT